MKSLFLLLLSVVFLVAQNSGPQNAKEKQLNEMNESEINNLIEYAVQNFTDVNRRIQFFAGRALGTPYLLFNLGEGPGSFPDPDPTIDFAQTDCMTFCEQVLALAISNNYSDMYANLQKIRYKNGNIHFLTRNHYTLADWLPNNDWLLKDVTSELGSGMTKTMEKTIDRATFFKTSGIAQEHLADSPEKETIKIQYIPTENLEFIKEKLSGGEIVSIVTKQPGVFSAHMGIIVIDKPGNIIFRHASDKKPTRGVMDETYKDVISQLRKSKNRVGMVFMRVQENIRIPQ